MRLLDADDLADFIAETYLNAKKIVEVGVGVHPWVAVRVKRLLPGARVVVTDVDEEKLVHARRICSDLEVVLDDVLKPQMKVYGDANLIYSVRPPEELVPEILKLAVSMGSDVLIRPYSDAEGGYDYPLARGWQMMNHKRATFYWLRAR